VLQRQLHVDVKELLHRDDLPGVTLRKDAGGVAHGQRLASSGDLVDPVAVVSAEGRK
jgi:hypothetical protein